MKKQTVKNVIFAILSILVIIAIGIVLYGVFSKNFGERKNPVATIEIEEYGTIKLELYPEYAPNTVANFICLANRGKYDGLTFHRTIPEFMIQGGDKNGDGTGSPMLSDIKDNVENDEEYSIKGEFIMNGYYDNTLRHKRGVISMARADYSSLGQNFTTYGYNSAGSQFFIVTKDQPYLDSNYAAFGEVREGMDVVDTISNVEVVSRESNSEGQDKPVNPPVIKSIRVETFGENYGEPETQVPFDYNEWLQSQFGGFLE